MLLGLQNAGGWPFCAYLDRMVDEALDGNIVMINNDNI